MDELDALWAFLVAAVIAFAATPPTARLARRLGVLHYPRERDLHDRPVPGLGGLAILAAAVDNLVPAQDILATVSARSSRPSSTSTMNSP